MKPLHLRVRARRTRDPLALEFGRDVLDGDLGALGVRFGRRLDVHTEFDPADLTYRNLTVHAVMLYQPPLERAEGAL